jgi:hypothetical protein
MDEAGLTRYGDHIWHMVKYDHDPDIFQVQLSDTWRGGYEKAKNGLSW